MAKFPSQNKITYQTGSIGTSLTAMTSGGTSGATNIPKDLALLNRRGYSSTTRKGVPLVYRCKVDYYLQDEDQNGISAAVGSDFASTLDIFGCQNNWVMRNAAVKWHAARDAMWRKAGIKRKNLGTYAKMGIKFNYDASAQTWVTPIDGDGDAFTGGDWDIDSFSDEQDPSYELKLVGTGVDEDSATTLSAMQIGLSYLQSRTPPPEDSNLETSEGPAEYSHLVRLLSDTAEYSARVDDIHDDVQALGDAPPYDNWTTEDTNNDITEPVLLGRALASLGSGFGSAIVDIPFGLCEMKASVHDAANTNVTSSGLVCVEVLDIYEMMG